MNNNKDCASCGEIVYPFEVIRCSDQVWHRKCFRCQHCGMALSVSNYHGYDKRPYCTAHNPKPTTFTSIYDTPELLRATSNTKMFSSVRYNADAQRMRGQITSFPDDLWTQHTLRLSKQYSEANNIRSGRSSGFDERYSPQPYRRYEARTGSAPYNSHCGSSVTPPPARLGLNNHCTSPHTFSNSTGIRRRSSSAHNGCPLYIDSIHHHHHYDQAISSPISQNGLSRAGSCHSITINTQGVPGVNNNAVVNNNYNVGSSETINLPRGSTLNLNFHNNAPHIHHNNSGFGGTFIAQYSYEAKDDDEVSFKPGDVIVNGEPISEGWMYGTVQRTGKFEYYRYFHRLPN